MKLKDTKRSIKKKGLKKKGSESPKQPSAINQKKETIPTLYSGWIKCQEEMSNKVIVRVIITDKRGPKKTITLSPKRVKTVNKQKYVECTLMKYPQHPDDIFASFVCEEEHRAFIIRDEDILKVPFEPHLKRGT